jgi:hypothetical protein
LDANHSFRRRRLGAVLALALIALVTGALVGASGGARPGPALAEAFARYWTRGDYAAMYADLDASSRSAISAAAFTRELAAAMRTATASSARLSGRARTQGNGDFEVPVRVRTRLFGALALDYRVSIRERGASARVRLSGTLEFPGLRAGERLSRRTFLPRRATLLARDGSVLAETPAGGGSSPEAQTRVSPLGNIASAVLGEVGPLPAEEREQLEAQGLPAQGPVGTSGIELALDERLRGAPGGELLAGARVLASASAHAAAAVRTTISPAVQRAAVEALGGQYGGVVAMVPSSGQILAVAGIGLDGLQPPGSTFKMVTVAGVLSAHLASPRTVFAYATHAVLDGVSLNNANGEDCGGSLALAFAVSCNSVFAPLGVKLGASRLVEMAEALGFNQPPAIAGAAESSLPRAREIEGELALGSTAIGQGKVLASPLEMVTVAASIGDGGRRPQPTFLMSKGVSGSGPTAMSGHVARELRSLMIGVVREGTGTAAAIPGVTVAGKTGTAELGGPCSPSEGGSSPAGEAGANAEAPAACKGAEAEAASTDAWFAAFAPAVHPRVAVGVMLVKDGAGGSTAAPVARAVLEAALRAGA